MYVCTHAHVRVRFDCFPTHKDTLTVADTTQQAILSKVQLSTLDVSYTKPHFLPCLRQTQHVVQDTGRHHRGGRSHRCPYQSPPPSSTQRCCTWCLHAQDGLTSRQRATCPQSKQPRVLQPKGGGGKVGGERCQGGSTSVRQRSEKCELTYQGISGYCKPACIHHSHSEVLSYTPGVHAGGWKMIKARIKTAPVGYVMTT